jgi:hypothetical protein
MVRRVHAVDLAHIPAKALVDLVPHGPSSAKGMAKASTMNHPKIRQHLLTKAYPLVSKSLTGRLVMPQMHLSVTHPTGPDPKSEKTFWAMMGLYLHPPAGRREPYHGVSRTLVDRSHQRQVQRPFPGR